MDGKIQTRLALLWALALSAAVLVPAAFAAGSNGGEPVTSGDPSVVLLTLGRQDNVTWEGLTQNISTKNNDCLAVDFADSPELLAVTAIGGSLGEVKDGLGVRGPTDGLGEPCGRVDAPDEAISVSLGAALADYLMTAVDLDLELKFNAVVEVAYIHAGVLVAEDTFNPMSGADDGPDSKDGDNFRYFNRPDAFFDEVVLRASAGSFSLEGGADLSSNDSEDAFGQLDPESKSSQFEVVATFDGEITCNDTVTINDEAVPGVIGAVTLHSMEFDPEGEEGVDWFVENCLLKLYNDDVTPDSLSFFPELEETRARYTITITVEDQPITVDEDGQITSLIMLYDPDGVPDPGQPLLACEDQPILDSGDEGYEAFWTQADVGLLPEGESACFYNVSITPTAEDVGTEVWEIFFEDDPGFSFK